MNGLLDALLFPERLHERSSDPGPFAEHRSYKIHLQREFQRKCVYCRVSDGLQGYEGFGVDHYLPKSKFPQLAAAWSNLFYACNVCNTWKGESVPTPERFLPNPCDHRMADHLQYRGADAETYTPHGEWLVELLQLAERRDLREFILSALGKFLIARNELIRDLITCEARLEDFRDGEKSDLLQTAIREIEEELERVNHHIERLTGEPVSSSNAEVGIDQQRRKWVPKAEVLKILRSQPPDPTFFEDLGEMGGTVGDLEDPWEKS